MECKLLDFFLFNLDDGCKAKLSLLTHFQIPWVLIKGTTRSFTRGLEESFVSFCTIDLKFQDPACESSQVSDVHLPIECQCLCSSFVDLALSRLSNVPSLFQFKERRLSQESLQQSCQSFDYLRHRACAQLIYTLIPKYLRLCLDPDCCFASFIIFLIRLDMRGRFGSSWNQVL
jgi:hypothetical protein